MTGPFALRALALTSLGVFVVFLDTTIVNVAFDTIGRDLDAGITALVWVLTAYSLVFAAVLLPAGRLADVFDGTRLFRVGLAGFAVSSALCGLAPNLAVLIAARAAQAVFGAVIVPSSLALLLRSTPPNRRTRAISIWGGMGAVATAIGPTAGALLIEYSTWRWVFLVNVPVCLAAAWWTTRLPAGPPRHRTGGLPDPAGVALSAAAPALLSFGVIHGPRLGWLDPLVLATLGAGAALVPLFVWRARRAAHPAVDLTLFRVRNFQASNVVTLVFSVSFFAVLLSSLLYLQGVWQYSVLRSALAVSPAALVTAVVAPLAGRLTDRYGPRAVFTAGALCYALGVLLLAVRTDATPDWVAHWLPSLVINGVGIGLALSALNSAAAEALPAERFGVGVAVNNCFRQLGALAGVSLFVAVLGTPDAAGMVAAYHRVWLVLASIAVVSAGLFWFAHSGRPRTDMERERGTVAQFDDLGQVYERSAVDLPFREHLEHYSLRRAAGDVTGLRVLDLGCGTGLYTRRFAKWGAAEVVGMDTSEGMLATARDRPGTPENARYLHRDAMRPAPGGDPGTDGRFDLVSSVYVFCYAATTEELAGFFVTARRALTPETGRLVAITLNPGYRRDRDYYAGYGFTLTQDGEGEGAPVTLHSEQLGRKFSVTAHWWSRDAYEHAAKSAGFTDVSWSALEVSDEGVAHYGKEYWTNYLAAPQAVLLRATV
ncbi:DHA2 family efflux MFS transporter permease subunit [Amycolatopsis suaedae]|uniref:DHA2 family efflux MFS transporter permease subunit n=1 Tax=Amycolatopsis suaedae TaxID=2510978 RepID=A0A4Q7JC53_9PSEU|nr:DHA2 family efflux MFS transporter permease subunit [Amycolatopsis suaedae]RZQ64602.1 DHA2 family efflux MFS transporter permease subunit [Amycolatopsis suaedae]